MQSPYTNAPPLDAELLAQKLSRYAYEPNPRFSEEEIMSVIQATYLEAQASLAEWRRIFLSPSPTPQSQPSNACDVVDTRLTTSLHATNTAKNMKADRQRYHLRPRRAKTQTLAKTQKAAKTEKPIKIQNSKKVQKVAKSQTNFAGTFRIVTMGPMIGLAFMIWRRPYVYLQKDEVLT
ncbi:uncharacterized protein DFL_005572 [Arthrobotrys flagrans]|uniref:Uncharacterized protein n=1 Tax=Arthrobotrys flagrans TaxID=97331 RepID=A0A436ZYH2_ARTFL|nr:hypothetical protein DFL_005572 [Arthrobotrys flagrans]